MSHSFARVALLIANLVTGVAILGLAGMLPDLATGVRVSVPTVGLLVTVGAVVLCIGAPLIVWATSAVDRRLLLAAAVAIVGFGHIASAFAPGYATLMALRILTMASAALVTPVAASTIARLVPPAERAAAIVFVFLGFSLAVAAGLPLVTFFSAYAGWQATFAAIGAAALASAALLLAALPARVRDAPILLRSWGTLARNRAILLLLLLTTTQVSGQFVIFTYLAPLLTSLGGAGTGEIAIFFALFGVMGFVGNVIATRLVVSLKPFRTSLVALGVMLAGFLLFGFGAGALLAMGVGVGLWGLGFAGINSMQQARLVGLAPNLSSASVALNTSAIYIGQAIGSGIGGVLLRHELPRALGYVAIVFMVASLGVLALTRDSERPLPDAAPQL
jgi:predicted MFS family arabinose efflux permease